MIIKLQKPDITCPSCQSKDININLRLDYVDCNNCGTDINGISFEFEDDQTFCNCDLCKKLMIDKGSEVN